MAYSEEFKREAVRKVMTADWGKPGEAPLILVSRELDIPYTTLMSWYNEELDMIEAAGGLGCMSLADIEAELAEMDANMPGPKQRVGDQSIVHVYRAMEGRSKKGRSKRW